MPRPDVVRLALSALAGSHADTWLTEDPRATGSVVTLHHVEPPRLTGFRPNRHLSVTPEFLDSLFARLKATGWRFVSVEDLIAAEPGDARRLAVTLDDGFRDNLLHAWPVFRRHNVPFTVYICPGFCDRTAELWWEALERIIAGADTLSLPGEGPPEMDIADGPGKQRAFQIWADWLTRVADETRQRAAIRALSDRYGLDLVALARELVMDWDEVRRMAGDPLCTIGAHTMTHRALARLPEAEAWAEMQDSAERIAREIGTRPATIAFPYGYPAAAGQREAGLAERAGFTASFTTRPGSIPASGGRHGLPRVSLNGRYQKVEYAEVLLSSGLWRWRDRLRAAARRFSGRAAASR